MYGVVAYKIVTTLGNEYAGRMSVNASNMVDVIVGYGIKFILVL